jgi:hypothetical protein|tara:strand:+ start:317 stop:493 length:177 start_codon:yes stop_codon:yes gene_type:complete
VVVKDDLKKNIEMMKKRIEEQNYLNSLVEAENSRQMEEMQALRNENQFLNEDIKAMQI